MRCPIQNGEQAVILLDYCARKLSADSATVLERHIESCAECGRFAAAQRTLWTSLDVWEAQPVSVDFDDRLYSRIEDRQNQSWLRRLWGDTFERKPVFPFAAACAAAALAMFLNVPATRPVPGPVHERTRVEILEPEQIERAVEDVEMLRQFSIPGGGQSLEL
jgi:hypothetical protein